MKHDSPSVNSHDFFSSSFVGVFPYAPHYHHHRTLFFLSFFSQLPCTYNRCHSYGLTPLKTTPGCAPHPSCNRKECWLFLPDRDLTPLPFLSPMLPILLDNRCAQLSKEKSQHEGTNRGLAWYTPCASSTSHCTVHVLYTLLITSLVLLTHNFALSAEPSSPIPSMLECGFCYLGLYLVVFNVLIVLFFISYALSIFCPPRSPANVSRLEGST